MKTRVEHIQEKMVEVAVLAPALVRAAEARGNTIDDLQHSLACAEGAFAQIGDVLSSVKEMIASGGRAR